MTPGSSGVTVSSGSKLATQFGTTEVDLNQVRYTRYGLQSSQGLPIDAVLVAIPGTLAASHSYLILAENLIQRVWDEQRKVVEVWGVDRRSVQLQDMEGLDIAEKARDARLGLDFLFGGELGLPLDTRLKRRAIFHESTDLAFMANWTPQVHSQDIDAVVDQARSVARNGNVFLAGHSAGTGFAARYAATDFNFSGSGAPQPGYAKLKGLVLFEGPGGALAGKPTPEQLDAVVFAAEGGLYKAVSSGAEPAFVSRPGLTPRVSASTEIAGMQMEFEGTINGSQALLQADQGGQAGNNAYAKVGDFTPRAFKVTAGAAIGTFMDDDNLDRTVFYSVSMGYLGDVRSSDGLRIWLDNNDKLPAVAFRDFGPQPATVSVATPPWGKEVEPTNLKRLARALFLGRTTYSDWYYPSSGLLLGNAAGAGGANLGLDTSALSLPVSQGGRGRADIVNQTQARRIDIPVIAFGGTNGLTPVAGVWRGFAEAIAPFASPSCKPGTPRTPAGQATLVADRKYGGVDGGFEVHLSEGYSHVDVLTADDDKTNNVVRPLSAFLGRNLR
jgi:pimeloyl-ACP methyl ester carboxylesterase